MRTAWLSIALLWMVGCASYPPPYEYDDPYYSSSGYNGVYDDAYYYDDDYAVGPSRYGGVYDVSRSYDPWFSLYWGWDYYGYTPYRHGYLQSRYDPFHRRYHGYGWSLWDYHWWPSSHYSWYSPYYSTWPGSLWYWRPYVYRPRHDQRGDLDSRQALRELPGRGLPSSYRPRDPRRGPTGGVSGPGRSHSGASAPSSRALIRDSSAPAWQRDRLPSVDPGWGSQRVRPSQRGPVRGDGASAPTRAPQSSRPLSSPPASGQSRPWIRGGSSAPASSPPRPASSYSRPSAPPPSRPSNFGSRTSQPAAAPRSAPASRSTGDRGGARSMVRGGESRSRDRQDD